MSVEHNPYDDKKLAEIRKNQSDPHVMYFIVRKSLNMSSGKISAQCAHAAQMVIIRYFEIKKYIYYLALLPILSISCFALMWFLDLLFWVGCILNSAICIWVLFTIYNQKHLYYKAKKTEDWMRESFRKVVLVAKDKEWEKLKKNLDCFVVKDAGLTEIDQGSETVIATWAMKKSECPKVIKKLQTLK